MVWGISVDMVGFIDWLVVWNMVVIVDVFLLFGFSLVEVMCYVYLSLVVNIQGIGMGGGMLMQMMYYGNLLGCNKLNDIFQEVLLNIIVVYVVQFYVGSYGVMIYLVVVCVIVVVLVEEGVDKIWLGKV